MCITVCFIWLLACCFVKKVVLIFKGGLRGGWYQTAKNWSESCENNFVSVMSKIYIDRSKICIFSKTYSSQKLSCEYFRFLNFFSPLHGPNWKSLTLTLKNVLTFPFLPKIDRNHNWIRDSFFQTTSTARVFSKIVISFGCNG